MVVINFVLIFIYLYLLSNIPGSEKPRNFRLDEQKKKQKKQKKKTNNNNKKEQIKARIEDCKR